MEHGQRTRVRSVNLLEQVFILQNYQPNVAVCELSPAPSGKPSVLHRNHVVSSTSNTCTPLVLRFPSQPPTTGGATVRSRQKLATTQVKIFCSFDQCCFPLAALALQITRFLGQTLERTNKHQVSIVAPHGCVVTQRG